MKTIIRDENDPVGGPAQKAADMFESALMGTLASMKSAGLHQTSDHLYVATMAIGSAINIAGKLMTMPIGNFEDPKVQQWATGPLTRSGALVACLLVARCMVPRDDGIDFNFSPKDILAAIKAAELLLGHNIDDELTPGMVKAARSQPEPAHIFDNDVVDMRTLH